MTKLADLITTFSDYRQALERTECALEKALNDYIDQRVAEVIKQPHPLAP